MANYKFKMGMFLGDTGLPLQEAAELAQDLGAEYVEIPVKSEDLTESHATYCQRVLQDTGLRAHLVSLGDLFKNIHIDQMDLVDLEAHRKFARDLDTLKRGVRFANILGCPNVIVQGFAWPDEYRGNVRLSPNWRDRYSTGGGVIPPKELDKLVAVFGICADIAETQDVSVAVGMMPWNYTNTSRNFLKIMERVDSPRLKCKWGPADTYNSRELDSVTNVYQNLKPYLTSLHLKDITVLDGPGLKFKYVPIGDGDVNYSELFRSFARDQTDVVLAVATHFQIPGDTLANTMRLNYSNTLRLTEQAIESDV